MNQRLERLTDKLKIAYPKNERHRAEAVDRVYMACERTGTDINYLLDSIEDGTAFDLNKFRSTPQGNIFDFVKSELLEAVKYFPHITAGGNGGMASIGRGEFAIAFLSNFSTMMITEGKGDLKHSDGSYEELKFNGGKIAIDNQRGEDVRKRFEQIVKSKGIEIKKVPGTSGGYLPVWKSANKVYSEDEIKIRNGYYHEAVIGQHIGPLTNDEIIRIFVKRAFNNIFKKVDSVLVIEPNGTYARFSSPKDGIDYYKGVKVVAELRNYQANPSSIYLNTIDKYKEKA